MRARAIVRRALLLRAAVLLAGAGAVACAVLVGASSLVACGGGSSSNASPSSCPNDLPASCPASPPSYAKDIVPILAERCLACHGDGGVEVAKYDFSTYDGVHQQASPMLNQVYACTMPPPDASAPTPAERQTLLTWLVCHAPNN